MGVAIRKVEGWGWIGVGMTEKGVAKVVLPKGSKCAVEKALKQFEDKTNQKLAEQCVDLLSRYLRGEFVALKDIPIDWGATGETHGKILRTLWRKVGIGRTITYGELAQLCGIPKGSRLVGQAMAKNPFPIIVPCHRVIRSDGSLGSFSGGIELKRKLLRLERSISKAKASEFGHNL